MLPFLPIVWTFLKTKRKAIGVVIAVLLAIGLVVWLYFSRVTITNLTTYLGAARDSLNVALVHVDKLQTDSTKLQNLYLVAENGRLEKIKEANQAKIDGLQAQQDFKDRDEQNYRHIQTMTAIQKKQAADLGVMRQRLGYLATTPADTGINGIVATMAGTIAIQDTTIRKQAATIGTLKAQNETLTTKNQTLTEQQSELEMQLNKVYNTMADKFEDVKKKKRFANYRLGQDIQKAANDIRAGRVKPNR